MCQLLGMNAKEPTDVVFSFTGFAQRAGRTGDHVDGWGISFFEDRGIRHFVDYKSAIDSPIAQMIRRYPIKSRNVISHIRKASQGPVSLPNCHPFVRELWGNYWVFAHNGDLKGYSPVLHGPFRPVGTTDSELAFCWIMQELYKSHAGLPTISEMTVTLRELSAYIGKFGNFNFLLSNGDALWAHASTNLFYVQRGWPFSMLKLSDEEMSVDFSEKTTEVDKVSVVVTAPLTDGELWTPFETGELKVFANGSLLEV